jgi:hypothetical protein
MEEMNFRSTTDIEVSENRQQCSINISDMNTADWRWAAVKGFWDPLRRCWNEEVGGMHAYLAQRNQSRAKRKALRQRAITSIKNNAVGSIGQVSEMARHHTNRQPTEFVYDRHDVPAHNSPFIVSCDGAIFQSNTESFNRAKRGLIPPALQPKHPYVPSLLAQTLGEIWPQPVCRRYWSLGYQAEPVLEIFHQLPIELRDAIGEMLVAIQQYADADRRHASCAARASQFFAALGAVQPDVAAEAESGSSAGPWEHDTVHAFIRVDFAPATQERLAVDANARAAELLGMRREELLTHYAQHAVPLALPPLDAVCGFLHSLRAAYDEVATRYARILVPGGAALVRVSSVKVFNTLRQLCQVPLPPAPRALCTHFPACSFT